MTEQTPNKHPLPIPLLKQKQLFLKINIGCEYRLNFAHQMDDDTLKKKKRKVDKKEGRKEDHKKESKKKGNE